MTHQGWLMCLGFLAVFLALPGAPLPSSVRSVAGKVPRVGLLGVTSAAGDARVEAMRLGFRDLGYVEGQNIKGATPANLPVEAGFQVRVRRQSQNRQGARDHDPPIGDQILD